MAGKVLFRLSILFTVVFSALSLKCNNEDCSNYYSYVFQTGGLAIYPATDSIRLGDTMWIVYDEPIEPLDLLSGDSIDLSGGTNFVNYVGVGKFNLNNLSEKALGKFRFGNKVGKLEIDKRFPAANLLIRPEMIGTRLKSIFFMVPTEIGDFQFGSDDVSPVKLNKAPPGSCGGATFKIAFANEDKHRWIHKLYVDSNYVFSKYDDEHVYTFRVY